MAPPQVSAPSNVNLVGAPPDGSGFKLDSAGIDANISVLNQLPPAQVASYAKTLTDLAQKQGLPLTQKQTDQIAAARKTAQTALTQGKVGADGFQTGARPGMPALNAPPTDSAPQPGVQTFRVGPGGTLVPVAKPKDAIPAHWGGASGPIEATPGTDMGPSSPPPALLPPLNAALKDLALPPSTLAAADRVRAALAANDAAGASAALMDYGSAVTDQVWLASQAMGQESPLGNALRIGSMDIEANVLAGTVGNINDTGKAFQHIQSVHTQLQGAVAAAVYRQLP